MRFYPLIAVALCTLACSDPRLDLHLVHSASAPIKNEAVEPTPCDNCDAQSWVAHDGTSIHLEVEHEPYLSIPAHRISEAEIVHERWLYRPYCDSFVLSFRLAISLKEITAVIEKIGDLPTVAIVEGRAVDAGRRIFQGETLSLTFSDRQRAIATAELISASPTFREGDDSWRAVVRRESLAVINKLLANPGELDRLAKEHGLQVEDLKQGDLAAQLFCP